MRRLSGMTKGSPDVPHWHVQGLRKMNPFCVPFSILNMPGALLAMDLGFMGPNYPINTACATGNYCILSCATFSILREFGHQCSSAQLACRDFVCRRVLPQSSWLLCSSPAPSHCLQAQWRQVS